MNPIVKAGLNKTITVTNTGNSGSVIGSSPPYICSGQGKYYWTITGGKEKLGVVTLL